MMTVAHIEPPARVTTPGLYAMPTAYYHSDPAPAPALSSSLATLIVERSPAHAKAVAPRLGGVPAETNGAMDLGSAAHAFAFGDPGDIAVLDFPNFLTKAAKEARDAALAEGRTPVLAEKAEVAQAMARLIRPQLEALLGCRISDAHAETALFWHDGPHGERRWRRSRMDLLRADLLVGLDYKTTSASAAPEAAGRRLIDGGYHRQEQFIIRGLDALDPDNMGRRSFYFVLQEQTPPYAWTVHEFDEAARTLAREQVEYACRWWDRCLERDHWPAYPAGVNTPDVPPWVRSAWIARKWAESHADKIDGAAA